MKLKMVRKLTDIAYQEALSKRDNDYRLSKVNWILDQLDGRDIVGWYYDEMIGINPHFPYHYQCSKTKLTFVCPGYQNSFLRDLSDEQLVDKILSWYDILISHLKLVPFISIDEWNEQHPVSKEAIRKLIWSK